MTSFRDRTTTPSNRASLSITFLIFDAGVLARDKNMLGEQIGELKGKVTGQRVLNVEGPTMETNVSAKGTIKGTQVNVSLTYVAKPTSAGVLHGEGQGVIMAGESDMAAYTGEAVGRFSSSGTKWRGALFFRTSSSSKLASLNNVVGLLEAEVDNEGNFSEKTWEWK
jgi:hypothetical protein